MILLTDIETRGYTRFSANGPLIEVDVTDFEKVAYKDLYRKLNLIINVNNR